MHRAIRWGGRAVVMAAVVSTGACATVFGGGSSQAVSIDLTPAAASFVVKSSSGLELARGSGTQSVSLPRRNDYQIQISAPGYQTRSFAITKATNGWIWANLLVGFVGFGVDFATGSAYKLEPSLVRVALEKDGDDAAELDGVIELFDRSGRVVSRTPFSLPAER